MAREKRKVAILIVEDNEGWADALEKMYRTILASRPCETRIFRARTADEAAANFLLNSAIKIDLLSLDINLREKGKFGSYSTENLITHPDFDKRYKDGMALIVVSALDLDRQLRDYYERQEDRNRVRDDLRPFLEKHLPEKHLWLGKQLYDDYSDVDEEDNVTKNIEALCRRLPREKLMRLIERPAHKPPMLCFLYTIENTFFQLPGFKQLPEEVVVLSPNVLVHLAETGSAQADEAVEEIIKTVSTIKRREELISLWRALTGGESVGEIGPAYATETITFEDGDHGERAVGPALEQRREVVVSMPQVEQWLLGGASKPVLCKVTAVGEHKGFLLQPLRTRQGTDALAQLKYWALNGVDKSQPLEKKAALDLRRFLEKILELPEGKGKPLLQSCRGQQAYRFCGEVCLAICSANYASQHVAAKPA